MTDRADTEHLQWLESQTNQLDCRCAELEQELASTRAELEALRARILVPTQRPDTDPTWVRERTQSPETPGEWT